MGPYGAPYEKSRPLGSFRWGKGYIAPWVSLQVWWTFSLHIRATKDAWPVRLGCWDAQKTCKNISCKGIQKDVKAHFPFIWRKAYHSFLKEGWLKERRQMRMSSVYQGLVLVLGDDCWCWRASWEHLRTILKGFVLNNMFPFYIDGSFPTICVVFTCVHCWGTISCWKLQNPQDCFYFTHIALRCAWEIQDEWHWKNSCVEVVALNSIQQIYWIQPSCDFS